MLDFIRLLTSIGWSSHVLQFVFWWSFFTGLGTIIVWAPSKLASFKSRQKNNESFTSDLQMMSELDKIQATNNIHKATT